MNKKFKGGDKVYCPTFGTDIWTLSQEHDLLLIGGWGFNQKGEFFNNSNVPAIFHATHENRVKLKQFYGVEFEKPKERKSPREIIQAMLDDGWKRVPCWVSDRPNPRKEKCSDLLSKIDHEDMYPYAGVIRWKYATPFDPKTGKTIIDYDPKTGEMELDDE